jgi:hypothetical protein
VAVAGPFSWVPAYTGGAPPVKLRINGLQTAMGREKGLAGGVIGAANIGGAKPKLSLGFGPPILA